MNQAQKKAVMHRNGPCLVLAGPGSGKTRVIVSRIKYLIEDCKIRPQEILVITFTKYAAAEMKQRLSALMGSGVAAVTAGTFHGIYYGILKWAYRFSPQNLLSEEEKNRILRQILHKRNVEIFDEADMIQDLISEISFVKNNCLKIEEYEAQHCAVQTFRDIYQEYVTLCKKEKKIDFDDMLILCYDLLERKPDVLKLWQEKFRYILVDEFQDINRVQYDVLRLLAERGRNLFVVGDDDQSIYGFRGADVALMFRFREDYPEAKQLLLDVNYRCAPDIVQNALRLIEHNTVRFSKKIRAGKQSSGALRVRELQDAAKESGWICSEIRRCIGEGVPTEEIAVLYRRHTDAEALTERLIQEKIPFQIREFMPNLYEHFIAGDLMAYLRMACGGRERADFLRIANRPVRYLSRDSVAGGRQVSFESLRRFYTGKEWMQERIEQLEWDLKILSAMAPYAAIQYLRRKVGYDEYLHEYARERDIEIADLWEIFSAIEEAAKPFRTHEEWFAHIREYTAALRKLQSRQRQKHEGVRLMTMHAAKGLEFHTVFIMQVNEGKIPCKKAVRENEIEEERRLFYVAMTRAKEMLWVTYVKMKNGKELLPSRFVEEFSDYSRGSRPIASRSSSSYSNVSSHSS